MSRDAIPLLAALACALSVPAGVGRASEATACADPVPVYEGGRSVGSVCPDEARERGLTVLDLSSDWAPSLFAEDDPYRAVYVALANGRDETADGRPVGSDRWLSVFGVFPSVAVLRERLLDDERHRCHAAVDADPLTFSAIQARLRCDGLLAQDHDTGRLDFPTRRALYSFQRRNFVFSRGHLDRATHDALATDSLEMDYQQLLRVLRERVVDATGLIEDGTAAAEHRPVLGRFLDPPPLRDESRPPLPDAAPDLVSYTTEAAAVALGWLDPTSAREMLAALPDDALEDFRVAVELPPLPEWHGSEMDLRIQIDRGDVWYDFPYDDDGRRRPQPVEQRPSFTLYARHGERQIALVRWPTTIGGWRREVGEDGEVGLRYKESPVGIRRIRDVLVAPAWLPPSTTPDDELMRETDDGRWVANRAIAAPGWASAFGLVMFVHHQVEGGQWIDEGIRTHGTASFRSVLGGYSHGCHRILNHLAVRLGTFVLRHRAHEARGEQDAGYQRILRHDGHADVLRIRDRGYLYELDPPIEVSVLRGNVRGERDEPPEGLRAPTSP